MKFFHIILIAFILNFSIIQGSICDLPKKVGPCKAAISRYFYNLQTYKCELFIYGGCQGNANNFVAEEECIQNCQKRRHLEEVQITTDLTDNLFCYLTPETGPCRAYFVRYYYDSMTGSCESFVYGGCGGNLNNFEDIETCLKTCS